MAENDNREGKRMAPPKLKLVSSTNSSRHAGPADDEGRKRADLSDRGTDATAGSATVQPSAPMSPPQKVQSPIEALASADRRQKLRIVEALLFASPAPLAEAKLAEHLPAGEDVAGLLAELKASYADRGVNLVRVAGKWAFRTAGDLAYLLHRQETEERRLSKAALETLAIIAYHQPVTRAEIEEIRGVSTSAGTLDILLESGWVRPRGRRRAPGRPVTYGTTESFLEQFSLDSIRDLPGLADLKASGLLQGNLPPDFVVPQPTDVAALLPDELPLDAPAEEPGHQGDLDLEPIGDDEESTRDLPASADLDNPERD